MNQKLIQYKKPLRMAFAAMLSSMVLWAATLMASNLGVSFRTIFSLTVSPYSGLTFWLVLILFIFVNQVFTLTRATPSLRNALMIIFGCFVIRLATASNVLLLLLLLMAITVYLAGKVTSFDSNVTGIPKFTFSLAVITLIVFVLCYFKYSHFQSSIHVFFQNLSATLAEASRGTQKHIFFVGVSYFTFKFIHFLVECYNNKINRLNLLTFINYTLFFPSFFSGPINRYNSFAENIYADAKPISLHEYAHGLKRIINGLFKKVVLANNLLPHTIAVMDPADPSVTNLKIILGIYAYMFYIYFDFSGYTDMAIGSARLVGIRLPENFNYPFLKRNLQQFWANWHMSLTTWLTDYIYWPSVRKLRHVKKLRHKPVTVSNICIILTFAVCGLWHGDGIRFLLWGLYHGIGLAMLNGFTYVERRYFSSNLKIFINKSRPGYFLSTFITFQYVAFGFFLFACDIEKQIDFLYLLL